MKQHLKIAFPLYLIMALLFQPLNAQDYDKSIVDQIAPAEPTASSLGKYGVYPVNYSTGLVPITIPLYTIKSGELTQSIELSYHGGGIRVNDEASWVGLGWDLNIGGGITRSVNGFPDEFESEIVPDRLTVLQQLSLPDAINQLAAYFRPLSEANTCDKSFKPDLYYYNFGSNSGTFFSKEGRPISLAHSSINGEISDNNIHLTSPNGDNYYFTATDRTVFHGVTSRQTAYNSNFGISKIFSLNNTDSILYEYQTDGVYNSNTSSFYQGYRKSISYFVARLTPYGSPHTTTYENIPITETNMSTQTITSFKPQYIYFNNGRIAFEMSSRSDMQQNYNTIKKLDRILIQRWVVEDQKWETARSIIFNYSYFNQGQDYHTSRLKLSSIYDHDYETDQFQLIASFDYYENNSLPDKESYSIDYWGFYNGANNLTPIPLTYMGNNIYGGADRYPNPYYAQTASLKSITYPTKGKTEFIWEGNDVYTETPPDDGQKKIEISLRGNTNLNHGNVTPESDKWVSADLYTPVTQTVTAYYYLYRNDIDVIDQDHKKEDVGKFYIGIIEEDGTCENKIELSPVLNATKNQQTLQLLLTAGVKYRLFVYTNCDYVTASIYFEYNAYNPNISNYFYPVAGLRIKEIKNYNENGQFQFGKKYTYLNPNGKTSGYMTKNRRLTYYRQSIFKSTESVGEEIRAIETTTHTINSTMTSGLDANNFAYEYVEEEDITSNQSNGKTVYKLNRTEDIFICDELPTISNSHLRGQVLLQTDYKHVDNLNEPFKKIREIQNYYSEDSRVLVKRDGFTLLSNLEFVSYESLLRMGPVDPAEIFTPMNYSFTSKWLHLDNTVTTDYITPSSTFVTDVTNIYCNINHLQPTFVRSVTSDGNLLLTHTKYASDLGMSDMIDRNMLIQPLEIKKYIKKGDSDSILTGGLKLTYAKDSYNHVNISQVSAYLLDGTTDLLNSYSYNQRCRLIEATGKDNIKTSIFWGIDGYNPLVIAKNISYSNLLLAIQSSTDLSLLYSKPACLNAQITTYTYKPLFGLSSRTDPRGVKTYFNYDNFGRTISILDNEQKILQYFMYHYKP